MFNSDPDPDWSYDPEFERLESLSNGVVDLIESGLFEEAERHCGELKARFPDQIDWIEHSAALCEARGQVDQAIEHDRRCLARIDSHPDGFDSDSKECYRSQIDRLRPTSTSVGPE